MTDEERSNEGLRCGYAVVDRDGEEQPCDRPATGWRWYQDCDHEDTLDIACDLHANEGGRRMAGLDEIARDANRVTIAAMNERDKFRDALLAVRRIGALSGTNLNAWNEAFDVIDAALRVGA